MLGEKCNYTASWIHYPLTRSIIPLTSITFSCFIDISRHVFTLQSAPPRSVVECTPCPRSSDSSLGPQASRRGDPGCGLFNCISSSQSRSETESTLLDVSAGLMRCPELRRRSLGGTGGRVSCCLRFLRRAFSSCLWREKCAIQSG